jgi:dTDP-4-dehydrorhamnose 3,5-epimerase
VEIASLPLAGAYVITPRVLPDERGAFLEWYRHEALTEAVGHPLDLAQANCSVSRRGVVRGIHYADVPPGQAKYITCARGAILDVVVDIRVGSPTFGRSETVVLDDDSRRAVYLAEGLGHGFCALTDDATVVYLCSTTFNPDAEHAITPMDLDLAIAWPEGVDVLLSPKDRAAPTLATARASGLLPTWEQCRQYAGARVVAAAT